MASYIVSHQSKGLFIGTTSFMSRDIPIWALVQRRTFQCVQAFGSEDVAWQALQTLDPVRRDELMFLQVKPEVADSVTLAQCFSAGLPLHHSTLQVSGTIGSIGQDGEPADAKHAVLHAQLRAGHSSSPVLHLG